MTDPRARAAALHVAAHARDAAEARHMLTILGLLHDGALAWPETGYAEVLDIKNVAATGAGGAGFR